ncbi:MAG: HD domain-containing phosphohydrolase [Spirochaetia bacterium]|jgi:HD-GYP domain-containing protein (c-di-GMP phosphodiesterase class II)
MIEVPIDYVTPGDILGKYHAFRKFEMGMSSSVDLERGYCITERVIRKLKYEYRVQYLFIEDPSPELKNVSYIEPYDEAERQQGITTVVHSMNRMKRSKVLDLREFGPVVEDILRNVHNILKNGKGSFKILSNTFQNVQSHDFYTWEHSVNTAIYAAVIALTVPYVFESVGITYSIGRTSRLESLVINMLLHDIGKVKIPEAILNKPERLDAAELGLMKKHPAYGIGYIREVNRELEKSGLPWIPSYLMQACMVHHQAYDGSGYPPLKAPDGDVRSLAAKEIPVIGRIAAVADIYDAVSSSRPFRSPFHPIDAIRILRFEAGKKLDPELVEAFIKNIYPFPVGATVILSTQELAVVIGYQNENKFEPIVRPIMKKVRRDGKEEIVRLPWMQQQNFAITPDSKIKIQVNPDIYKLRDDYYQ